MKSYSTTIFTAQDFELLDAAQLIVRDIPDDPKWNLRCHEVARVVGKLLHLQVVDGKYGAIEHSWCVTPDLHILDVYAVGRMPQVQLADPFVIGELYKSGWKQGPREDIREEQVTELIRAVATPAGIV